VKECVLQADPKNTDFELGKLRNVVDRCNVVITERKSSKFSTNFDPNRENSQAYVSADFAVKNIEQDLNRLLNEETASATLRMCLTFRLKYCQLKQ
jgi:DNA mismatch repair protein MSH2